ncbi:MAG: imidazole glycerol phosphate synthase subunit HisH, partial [Desulfobacterales bacterium]
GIVPGEVRAFPSDIQTAAGEPLKIPHMGWNGVQLKNFHPLLEGICAEDEFYFVHGFYPEPADATCVLGVTDYGLAFASILAVENLFATQFHAEKSGRPGLRMLQNFCNWKP